jgi:hypothetical protein
LHLHVWLILAIWDVTEQEKLRCRASGADGLSVSPWLCSRRGWLQHDLNPDIAGRITVIAARYVDIGPSPWGQKTKQYLAKQTPGYCYQVSLLTRASVP